MAPQFHIVVGATSGRLAALKNKCAASPLLMFVNLPQSDLLLPLLVYAGRNGDGLDSREPTSGANLVSRSSRLVELLIHELEARRRASSMYNNAFARRPFYIYTPDFHLRCASPFSVSSSSIASLLGFLS